MVSGAMVTRTVLAGACGLLAVLLGVAPGARAAMVCEARVDRTRVPAGGELVLTVSAEGDVGWSVDFALPDLPAGVRVSSGGTNQSMSMVNGQTRASVARTWYLRMPDAGVVEIGPVTVTARGQTCRTDPLRVTVTAPPAGAPPADTGNRTPPPQMPPTAEPGSAGGDIFVTLEVDKPRPWLGEQVILTFRYWRRVQPWNNPTYNPPRTEGFWREDLGPERALREVRDGRVYSVTEIRYALFPTRAGRLVIEPAELVFPEDVFDRFFNTRRRAPGPRILRSERLTVDVRPLPEPAPPEFTGLVANDLELTARVAPDTVAAGEPVEFALQLAADGFLKGFEGLRVTAPEGARMHDAAESFAFGLRGDRLHGSLGVEKVLVPEQEGLLAVPATSLTWFDADQGRYVTSSTPVHQVRVRPGSGLAGQGEGSGFLRSEIARLGQDLAFIHPVPRRLRGGDGAFTGSAAWWLLLVLPAVLLAAWRIVLVRLEAARRDPAGRRRRRALAAARGALAAAAGDPARVARAIRGYVADRTDRPLAAVDGEAVAAYAAAQGCPAAGADLAALLTACDEARFGGGPADGPALAARAGDLLRQLDASPGRVGGRGPALALVLAWALAAAAAPVSAQVPGADPVRLLAEGNQAYTEGDLDRALLLYGQVRALGGDDPVLHYNLGNTHARRGELGLAVASYLRAQRLDPRDEDTRANLAWVRRQIRDLELEARELPLFIRQFVGLVGRFTLGEWAAAVLVLVWAVAAVVAWGWYRGGFGDPLRRAGLTLAALLLVAGAVTAWRWHGERIARTAVVIAAESAVRSGPAETFPVLFMVHDGLTVRLDGDREGWVRVSLGGDWQGWLPRTDVEPVAPEPPQGR